MSLKLSEKTIKIIKIAIAGVLAALVVFSLFFDWDTVNSYALYNTSSLHYEKGTVLAVVEENLSAAGRGMKSYCLARRHCPLKSRAGAIAVRLLKLKIIVSVSVPFARDEGTKLIICVDEPEGVDAYYTVFQL